MVFHEGRNGIVAICIVKHRNVMVDSLLDPRTSCIRCLLFAEVGNDDRELIVFREMAQPGVVLGVADVEDKEDACSPLLDGKQPSVGRTRGLRRPPDIAFP